MATLTRSAGKTLELTMVIPWATVKTEYDKVFTNLLTQVEVAGFRKGHAPRDLAEKQIDKSRVYEEVINHLIPQIYADAVREHNLKPIINPQIELVEAEENKDWKIKATTCEKPDIALGNYKQALTQARQQKKSKLWVPGKDEKKDEKDEELTLSEILEALSAVVKIDFSPLLIEQEVNRKLSNLISETQKLGLSIEQYMQTQGKNKDSLRTQFADEAKKELLFEFALEEIAEKEGVTVDSEEVEKIVQNAKTPEEKQLMTERRYYITSVLRRQKTLNQLLKPTLVQA